MMCFTAPGSIIPYQYRTSRSIAYLSTAHHVAGFSTAKSVAPSQCWYRAFRSACVGAWHSGGITEAGGVLHFRGRASGSSIR
eukprot:1667681-Rhodomonas_salina.2